MRTTLNLDEDVLQIAKSHAEARSVSLGTAISELIRRGLQREWVVQEENGFPVFYVPPGGRAITIDDVKQLEDEL